MSRRLPNSEAATVSPLKLTGYLLSAAHPRGRGKARFFTHFGFSTDAPGTLERALLLHAQENAVVRTIETPHGTKYEIEGPLQAPGGRKPVLKSVWIIERHGDVPRFVTAMPGPRLRE